MNEKPEITYDHMRIMKISKGREVSYQFDDFSVNDKTSARMMVNRLIREFRLELR